MCEATISITEMYKVGVEIQSPHHPKVRGVPRTLRCRVPRLGGREMRAPSAQLTAPRAASFAQTPVLGRTRGTGHRAQAQ